MPVSEENQLNNPAAISGSETLPDVSIIIVSYNVASLLADCLNSLIKRPADGLNIEIIVVDNASADGSPDLVRQNFPEVKLVANQYNYGFPRGCNQGLRRARGRYLFFLNPDAALEAGSLQKLVGFMEKQPRAGIVAPLVRYPDGSLQPNRRRFPGPALAFVESTILERYRPFRNLPALRRFKFSDVSPEQAHEVDWIVGAAFLVRREVIEAIGGLDERYFMYSEELDFCRRAKEQGWQIWYEPAAAAVHQEGQSSKQDVPARHINFHTSKLSYYRKFYGRTYAGLLRSFLLGSYLFQYAEEWAKLQLRHKPDLRRERLQLIRKVLASGLRPYRSPYPRPLAELDICLLSAEYFPQPGGVGDYTACLGMALAAAGAGSVEVLTGQSNRQPAEPTLPAEALVKKWGWQSLPQIAKYLRRRPVAVLNIQYQTGAYSMRPAINFLPLYLKLVMGQERPKIITTFHDLRVPYLFPKAGRLRKQVNRLLLKSGDMTVVTNPADYRQALEWGARQARLKLIPIGSNITPGNAFEDAAARNSYRASLGIAESDFAVGYFGLLNPGKGVDTLLEAFGQLLKKDQSWKLVIIGGEAGETDLTNRPYARELEELIRRLGIEKHIIRTGHLDPAQTSKALLALDGVALPFREGASFRRGSLLAPLAHGLPVVTTQPSRETQSGPEEPQLIDRQNVLLVAPAQPGLLANALEELRQNSTLRESLRTGALELSRNFSWDGIASRFLEIYQN
ncbi:MAG TPA: glycosyltransferase [Chloroflexia bacterium]|nr:glycosyltransferase [Chloroflexia bacterium]